MNYDHPQHIKRWNDLGDFKNRDSHKSSILMVFSIITHPHSKLNPPTPSLWIHSYRWYGPGNLLLMVFPDLQLEFCGYQTLGLIKWVNDWLKNEISNEFQNVEVHLSKSLL